MHSSCIKIKSHMTVAAGPQ